MKPMVLILLGALALSGCAGHRIKPPAVCDGKHRRPANLYGTILPTLPVPLPASQGGGQSAVAPPSREAVPAPAPAPTTNPDGEGEKGGSAEAAPVPAGDPPRLSHRDVALSFVNC